MRCRHALLSLVTACCLAGCGSTKLSEPHVPSTSSDPTTASTPTSTAAAPSPTGRPAMPEAARAHTPSGAVAFVKYYWAATNYAQAHVDPSVLTALADPNCKACTAVVKSIEKARRQRARIEGGVTTVTTASASLTTAGEPHWTLVRFHWSATPELLDYPAGKKDAHYRGGQGDDQMLLRPVPSGWRITYWDASA